MITLTFDPNATAHVLSVMQAQQSVDVSTLLNAAAVNVIAACEATMRERPVSASDEQEEARAGAVLEVVVACLRSIVDMHRRNVQGKLPPDFRAMSVEASLEADELGRDRVRFRPLEIQKTGGE